MNAAVKDIVRGFIRANVPYAKYAMQPGVRISALKEIAKSPLHYRWRLAHPKQSKALSLGSAAHTAVLEPEAFEGRYAVWNRRSEKSGNLCPRNGQHWEAFVAASEGKEIITEDEREDALSIAAAVRGNPLAMRYLAEGRPEISMEWTMESDSLEGAKVDVQCKCRVDWGTRIKAKPTLAELKTSGDIEPLAFGRRAEKFGYHMQLAWQHDGYETITGDAPDMCLIVVESFPPHDVTVCPVPVAVLERGREDYQELLRRLVECEQSGQWPGVAGGVEVPFMLPSLVPGLEGDLTGIDVEWSENGDES